MVDSKVTLIGPGLLVRPLIGVGLVILLYFTYLEGSTLGTISAGVCLLVYLWLLSIFKAAVTLLELHDEYKRRLGVTILATTATLDKLWPLVKGEPVSDEDREEAIKLGEDAYEAHAKGFEQVYGVTINEVSGLRSSLQEE